MSDTIKRAQELLATRTELPPSFDEKLQTWATQMPANPSASSLASWLASAPELPESNGLATREIPPDQIIYKRKDDAAVSYQDRKVDKERYEHLDFYPLDADDQIEPRKSADGTRYESWDAFAEDMPRFVRREVRDAVNNVMRWAFRQFDDVENDVVRVLEMLSARVTDLENIASDLTARIAELENEAAARE